MRDKAYIVSNIVFMITSIIVFSYFIWPTPWTDIKVSEVQYGLSAYETDEEKTNRFSGNQCEIAVQDIDRVYANGDCWLTPTITILLIYSFVTICWAICFSIEQKKKIIQLGNTRKAVLYFRRFFRGVVLFASWVFVSYLLISVLYITTFN